MSERNDDDDWLDLMAGRDVPQAPRATRSEATLLRRAWLSRPARAPEGQVREGPSRAAKLLERAARAGVIGPDDAAGRAWWPAWLAAAKRAQARNAWRWAGAAGLAMLLAALALPLVWRPGAEDTPTLRGAPEQTLNATRPAARQGELLTALRAAGLDVQPFERLGRLGLDIELPVPLGATAARALRDQGLVAPPGPQLIVWIDALKPDAPSR